MGKKNNQSFLNQEQRKLIGFAPRIINPVKISHALIFSADELVRKASATLQEQMPWIKVQILTNPLAVVQFKSEQASVLILDDTALNITETEKIRQTNKDIVLILLSLNELIHRSPPSVTREKFPFTSKADLIFAADEEEFHPEKIIVSAVRCGEDLLNIQKYSKERRFIFLVVDDEPRWFSQFLPVLYNIIGQRGDVMVTRTYEETLNFLFGTERESEIDPEKYYTSGHGDDVVCVITDIFFPRGDDLHSDAGRDLFRLLNRYYPRIPVIIASKAKEAYELQDRAFILPKGDYGSVQTLRDYIHDYTGLGDFLIQDKAGDELHRVKNIYQIRKLLVKAEKDTPQAQNLRALLEIYAQKDAFSTWLYMHGFKELGDKLRPKQDRGKKLVEELKKNIDQEISRIENTPLFIGDNKVFHLQDLLVVLKKIDPQEIQKFSDLDVFSTWLDRKSYPQIAEEIRPIHGSGEKLRKALVQKIEKWMNIYAQRKNQSKPQTKL